VWLGSADAPGGTPCTRGAGTRGSPAPLRG
jgi:hypothetical protein